VDLDTFYPAMLGLTLISTISWFGQRMPNRKLVRFGIAFAIRSAFFNYTENIGSAAMIWIWPQVPDPLVYATGTATILKSSLTSAAILLTLLVGLSWARLSKAVVSP
jgi:hypothetical protein